MRTGKTASTTRPTVPLAALLAVVAQPAWAQRTAEEQDRLAEQLDELIEMRREMQTQMEAFDRRIADIEAELRDEDAAAASLPDRGIEVVAVPGTPEPEPEEPIWGPYEPGRGFVLARGPQGEVDFSVFSYARYLYQKGLDETYTDAFGRTTTLDLRNDVQMQKVTLNFKGWLFDPKFRYLFYTWTSNTSQGDPAQVVVAGNLNYDFSEHFTLSAGIGALPTTRSTNYTFPNWLKNDHRSIADEFFRGSYTTGIWASGMIKPGLEYRAMIGNNLSQLGVNAAQLDDKFNTLSGAIWWMPTTGEYGPGQGFGDYEYHDELATLFGLHMTRSREDAQGQPGTEGFENSQLRLSDGTRIFSPDPFLTGADVRKATYQMMAINGGFKYRGFSLDAEAYFRKLDNFVTTGPIPVDEVTDHGFQVQGSMMVKPGTLQAYAEYSKVYGDYGDPYDFSLGLNWFPLERKEMRLSFQGLYLKDSPVGYSSVPFPVGGNGWVFSTDAIVAF